MNDGNIGDDNEETLGPNGRAMENDGWGKIGNINGSTRTIKTKGSWAYTRCTLSCDNPTDPLRIEVPSLEVLTAKQVAAHISEEDILKLAPLHVNLIRMAGTKRKQDKGKGEWSPTPTQTQKKAKKNEQDTSEGCGEIK